MSNQNDSYLALIRSVEGVALAARHLVLLIMVLLFFMGYIRGNLFDLGIITGVVIAHSLFAHWALWSHRYTLLVSPFNFLLYLFEFSIIVSFSGADESPGFVLYVLFLIGFSAYRRELRTIMLAALACCAAFTVVLLIEWRVAGMSRSAGELIFKQLSILAGGWLVGNLSHRLLRLEQQSFSQAQRVASSEAALRTILDHAADPILVFDENEFVVDANDGACQYFNTSREELVGQRVRSFLFDDGTIPQKFAAMRRRGFFNGEQLVIGPDGEERAVELIVRSFTRDDKQYYVALGHDVTPQKELQEATRQANLRLERLNRELRHVDQLRTGFLSTISRKLRSPLSAVLGYIEMLLQEELGDLTKDQRKALQTCRRGTLRAFRIIEETLAIRKEEEFAPAAANTLSPDTWKTPPDGPESPTSLNGVGHD